MSQNDFMLKIVGPDVSPRSVDVDDLSDVIKSYRGALASLAGAVPRLASNRPEEITLGLIGVSSSQEDADILTLYGSDECVACAAVLNDALSNSTEDQLPARTREYLRSLWKATYDNGWDSCEFIGNGSGIGTASISRERELIPDKSVFRGMTILYGKCFRVGGMSKQTARLRLANGDLITVHLRTKALAKEIGAKLHRTVGLAGEATWESSSQRLDSFVAESLTDYSEHDDPRQRRTNADSLKALSIAAGNRWDGVDPEQFVQEQRRD